MNFHHKMAHILTNWRELVVPRWEGGKQGQTKAPHLCRGRIRSCSCCPWPSEKHLIAHTPQPCSYLQHWKKITHMVHHCLAVSWFSFSSSLVSWSASYKSLFCLCVKQVCGWILYYPLLPSRVPTPPAIRHTFTFPPPPSFLVGVLEVL